MYIVRDSEYQLWLIALHYLTSVRRVNNGLQMFSRLLTRVMRRCQCCSRHGWARSRRGIEGQDVIPTPQVR